MRIHVLSLGCPRTLVDSEGLAGILARSGHPIAEDVASADCVVINTCAFIREAEEESISAILDAAALKRAGRLKRLFVAGCLPQKRRGEKEDLLKLLPEVDGFLGPGDLSKLPGLMMQQEAAVIASPGEAGAKQSRFFVASPVPTLLFDSTTPRHRLTPGHFAYLKISEGCDHACSFCAIPQFRGPHRSRAVEDLVEEAQAKAGEGVVELNLIGQDTSFYGMDRYGRLRLPDLLERLNAVGNIRWIRILYAHPAHVTPELIAAIRDLPKVAKYLDLPIQHASDRILAAMRRETDGACIRRLVGRIRQAIPGIALRTTFIVGFPGETEQELEELARFMREIRFERVGIFPYSPEPRTPAEKLPDPVPEDVKQERLKRLMELQQEISRDVNEQFLGRELEILVDELVDGKDSASSTVIPAPDVIPDLIGDRSRGQAPAGIRPNRDPRFRGDDMSETGSHDFLYLGRTYADAPEVDGQVFVRSGRPLRPGEFVRARVEDTYEYDLVAEALEPHDGFFSRLLNGGDRHV